MICSRINLRRTVKDELLFSALVEASPLYSVSVNGKNEGILIGERAEFVINTNNEGQIFNICVSPQMKTSNSPKVRINIVRKNNPIEVEAVIVITVNNPYRVTTDGAGRYIIVHSTVNEEETLNNTASGKVANGVGEFV